MGHVIAISEDTIQLCWDLREAIWEHLAETLSEQVLKQVRDYDALGLYANIASGRLIVDDFGRVDAPRSLVDVLAGVLRWLPRKHWPDRLERYAEDAPLALEALQVYGWKAGIEDRRPPADDGPGELEQLAAAVIAEDEAGRDGLVKVSLAQLEAMGLRGAEQLEFVAGQLEQHLNGDPDLDPAVRAQMEADIERARRIARQLREQGR
jgi:hypothetical protein